MSVGELIAGRYRIVRYIAAGGMGTVWEATDTLLDQPVALKQVTFTGQSTADATESRRRTMREARNAARLRNEPDVIGIYDVLEIVGGGPGAGADAVWLGLEYLPSSSLADILSRTGRVPFPDAARIGAGVARALAAAHRSGIVHRDVKPGNVLIAESDGRVKLTDFGISYAEGDARVTATHQLSGTPAYMAREVAAGDESTPASDVFSLASTLYRAVEGRAPFGEDDNVRRLVLRVASEAVTPPGSAGPLTPLLMQMFDPDPRRRPSAAAVADGLLALAARPDAPPLVAGPPDGGERRTRSVPPGGPVWPPTPNGPGWTPPPAPGPPHPPPPAAARRRRRGPLIATAVVAVALVVATVVVRPWETSGSPTTPVAPAGTPDLAPVAELSVPADAVRPAGAGGAVCPPVAIAYVGALTGPNAALGTNMVNGTQLAVNQHNQANPGCQVQLKRFDTTGTPAAAPPVVTALAADRDVVGVVGPGFSGETKVTGSLFAQAGLAHITASATNPALSANGWRTFLRGLGSDAAVGRNAARLMTDRLGARRVCVVRDDSPYGGDVAEAVDRSLGSFSVPECRQRVATGQADMRGVAGAVTAAAPDAVFYGGYYAEAAPLYRQLTADGFRGRFVAPDGVKDPEFVRLAGAGTGNAYVLCPCAPGELVPEFASAYTAAAGAAPGTYSLEAYDAATVLLRAVDSGRRDRAGVLAAVRANDSVGLTKRLRWSETGEPEDPPVYAYRVVDGRITFVGRVAG